MKTRLTVLFLILWVGTAFAGPPSLQGGKLMPIGRAHQVGVGLPSLFYEWWHSGTPDWAIGGEVVYGDWSGGYSNVNIGGAFNMPFRWHLKETGSADIALQVKPGILFGSLDEGRFDGNFVFGVRGELSVPVTIELTPKVNLITGGAIPLTYMIVDNAPDYFVLPLLARVGAEVQATETITPWLLFELGPAIRFGDGTDAEFAFRIWVGSSFF